MSIPTLFSGNLCLRPLALGDISDLIRIWSEPQVSEFLFGGREVTYDRGKFLFEKSQQGLTLGIGTWTIRTRTEIELVLGSASLQSTEATARLEPRVGGLIEPVVAVTTNVRGKHFGREALGRLLDYTRDDLHEPVIAASADIRNARALWILKAMEFEYLSEVSDHAECLMIYTKRLMPFPNEHP